MLSALGLVLSSALGWVLSSALGSVLLQADIVGIINRAAMAHALREYVNTRHHPFVDAATVTWRGGTLERIVTNRRFTMVTIAGDPHVHCIVTGGGLTEDGSRVFDVDALKNGRSALIRGPSD